MNSQKFTTDDWIVIRFGEKPDYSVYRKLICKCEVPSAHGTFAIGAEKEFQARCLECGGLYDVVSRPPKQLPGGHKTLVAVLAVRQLEDMAYNEPCHCGKPVFPTGKFSIGEKVFCQSCSQTLGKISITF